MIIIETPAPPTRERLVLVPADAVSRTASEPALNVHTSAGRDATPADLARGGYVRDDDTRAGLRDALRARERAELDALAELDEQRARAEKAEGLLIQHETELRLAREDGDVSEQGRHAAIFEANRRQDEWKLVVARAEKAERELATERYEHDATLKARDMIHAKLTTAERERDEAKAGHNAVQPRVYALEAELADAKAECAGAMLSAHAQYAETVRERDQLRAELARLTAPGEGSEGEPTDEELLAAVNAAWAANMSTAADARRALFRAGVAHKRARQQPAKDRATDEELFGIADGIADGLRAIILAVAARVRQERCLVAQAVAAGADIHVTEVFGNRWRVVVTDRDANSKMDPCLAAADVPATLARLLGEVGR